MAKKIDGAMPQLTRRELLTQVACGAAVVSAAPYLKALETPLATHSSSPRITESFDFGWKFSKSDASGAELLEFDDAGWRALDLPHDWSIEGPIHEHAPSSGPGGYMPTGIGWYRKTFIVPESYRGKVITLEFDGVYQNSDVWINGHHLGRRPYGYIPFVYELTGQMKFGADNVVAVRVDNSRQTNCRWYSGSGIYRHTWLHVLNPVHVAQWGTFVTCPRVQAHAATIEVRTAVANSRNSAVLCKLLTAIIDAGGATIASLETPQTIAAGDSTKFFQQIEVPTPALWSPGQPNLYSVRSTLRDRDDVIDEYDTPFGIREAIFDAEHGFLLNGEHIKLNGVCIHHEAGSVGAAVPLRVWERRLEILKEMGCNAIRTSHNPYATEFLDLCDRMGFLVMAEAFDEWKIPKGQIRYGYSMYFDEWHERDLENFLHRDRNHPSIVLWSAGNEVPDQSAPDGAETLRQLLGIFHREDPTRPVTAACDRIASEPPSNTVRPEFLAELDIVGYNYVDRWRDRAEKYYSIDHAAFPSRRVIGTESGGMGGIRGDYRSLFPSDLPAAARRFLFQQNRAIDTEQLWQFVSTYDYVAGDFMWTGIDYLGESFWPMRISPSGVLDTCAFKKDGFYFYQSRWTEKPMIHLFPHWNWAGKEGEIVSVACYTNCDTVELFLNGKSYGVKGYEFPRLGMEGTYGNYPARARALRTTADLHLSWDVPYQPGMLKAVGVKDGAVAVTVEVATAGAPAAIALSADRMSIAADRRDVAHIVVEIHDDKGQIAPTAMNQVTFTVEGEGKLIGVDNGDPSSHEDFKSDRRRAFNGMCMAIVQSTASAGTIGITAISPGLRPASIVIHTGTYGA
ncbi:MAG TPA: glycoside hydrolase family 2 TIM barrel-domain containing protein [Terracidiphilus sp.]|jgi:beta-galactosidase